MRRRVGLASVVVATVLGATSLSLSKAVGGRRCGPGNVCTLVRRVVHLG